jgi:hypothetical protein
VRDAMHLQDQQFRRLRQQIYGGELLPRTAMDFTSEGMEQLGRSITLALSNPGAALSNPGK